MGALRERAATFKRHGSEFFHRPVPDYWGVVLEPDAEKAARSALRAERRGNLASLPTIIVKSVLLFVMGHFL